MWEKKEELNNLPSVINLWDLHKLQHITSDFAHILIFLNISSQICKTSHRVAYWSCRPLVLHHGHLRRRFTPHPWNLHIFLIQLILCLQLNFAMYEHTRTPWNLHEDVNTTSLTTWLYFYTRIYDLPSKPSQTLNELDQHMDTSPNQTNEYLPLRRKGNYVK